MNENTDTLLARIDQLETARDADRRRARWSTRAAILGVVLLPVVANALGPVPYEFAAGDLLSAAEMNDNFAHLQDAITALETSVGTLNTDLAALDTEVFAMDEDLSLVEGQVAGALAASVPSGTMAWFNASTCPAHWTEVTEVHGRTIVGMNGSAGTAGLQVGTSTLADGEDRTHTHTVNPDSISGTTGSAGAHNHRWKDGSATYDSSGNLTTVMPAYPFGAGTNVGLLVNSSTDYYTDNESAHTHSFSVNLPSKTSSSQRTSDVMPYVQFLLCAKS